MIDRALKENELTEGVFECHYDSELGEWRYNRPRFDAEADDANMVIEQLEYTANNIDSATLIYSFDEKWRARHAPQASSPIGTSSAGVGTPRQTPVHTSPMPGSSSRSSSTATRTSQTSQPTKPLAPSPSQAQAQYHHSTRTRANSVSPPSSAHSARLSAGLRLTGNSEAVLETPSPPLETQQGLKRALPDAEAVGTPESKRVRTE